MSYTQKLFAIFVCTTLFMYFIISNTKNLPISDPIPVKSTVTTELSFAKNPVIVTENQGSSDIIIDTGDNSINFVQIQLSYNPGVITDMKFTNGSFFKNAQVIQNAINQEKGLATYILMLPKNEKGKKGIGTIASVTFTTNLRDGDETPLTFTKETLVTNQLQTTSVLKNTIDTKIIQKTLNPKP